MTGPAPTPPPIGEVPEVRAWLSQNFDHTLVRQRSQVETAKLLVTLALGISATIVATALQVDLFAELEHDQSRWNDEIVSRVRAAAVIQLLLSGAAGTTAAVSLLLAKT